MEIESMLINELKDELTELSKLEVGSKEYEVAIEGIKKLYDMMTSKQKFDLEQEFKRQRQVEEDEIKERQFSIEQEFKERQFDAEQEFKRQRQAEEDKLKEKQHKKEVIDKVIDTGLKICEITLPIVVTVWGTMMVLDFEKEEIVGSFFSKSWLQKLVQKK